MRPIMLYKHVQDVASDTWTIVHNLGTYPVIDVYTTAPDDTVQKVLPETVTFVDNNTVTLGFSAPETGFATVAG